MQKPITALVLLLALAACGQPPEQVTEPVSDSQTTQSADSVAQETQSESQRLNSWFDAKYEELLQLSPIQLTFLGRKERNNELDDFSMAGADLQLEWARAAVAEMQREFDYDQLDAETKTSWDIWMYQYEQSERAVQFRNNGLTFEQMNGAQSFLPTFLISFHLIEEAADVEALISRIRESARALDQLLVTAQESSQLGVITPGFALDGVIQQSRNVISGIPFTEGEDSAMWTDAKTDVQALVTAGTLDQLRADELLEQTRVALMEHLGPAYERVIAWAEAEKAKVPEISTGLVSQPNGLAYYNYLLETQTTTTLTADEIHQIGLADVARLRSEMEAVKELAGFSGTLQEFFVMLRETRDEERFYYPNDDAGRHHDVC